MGSLFHVAHGLADAIILPYIIRFNSGDERARALYESVAAAFGTDDMAAVVQGLNKKLHIPVALSGVIKEAGGYRSRLGEMAAMALADGCTKTNPIIPTAGQMEALFTLVFDGKEA